MSAISNSGPCNSKCINNDPSFDCECNDGFTEVYENCENIDECKLECEDIDECKLECEDIDECKSKSMCEENEACVNNIGSFTCINNREVLVFNHRIPSVSPEVFPAIVIKFNGWIKINFNL